MLLRNSIAVLVSAIVFSCAYKSPRQQMQDFMNDPGNRMEQAIQVGQVKLVAKWLPHQYTPADAAPYKRKGQPYRENFYYFKVRFETATTLQLGTDKRQHLQYGLQSNFRVVCGNDTVKAVFCHTTSSRHAGSYEYMVVFAANQLNLYNNTFTLCYDDKVFDMGIIAIAWRKQDIAKMPAV